MFDIVARDSARAARCPQSRPSRGSRARSPSRRRFRCPSRCRRAPGERGASLIPSPAIRPFALRLQTPHVLGLLIGSTRRPPRRRRARRRRAGVVGYLRSSSRCAASAWSARSHPGAGLIGSATRRGPRAGGRRRRTSPSGPPRAAPRRARRARSRPHHPSIIASCERDLGPSTVPRTPLRSPTRSPYLETRATFAGTATIAAASGCSLARSRLAASCSSVARPDRRGHDRHQARRALGERAGLVDTIVSTARITSIASALRNSTPIVPAPVATMIDIGVARRGHTDTR